MNPTDKTILEEFKKFLDKHKVSKKHLLKLVETETENAVEFSLQEKTKEEGGEASMAWSIDLIVLKIAENLTRKDYARLRAVNKMFYNILDPVPPLSCKKDVLKWKERNLAFDCNYRCRTSDKLKEVNLPKISEKFNNKDWMLCVNLGRQDDESHILNLLSGLLKINDKRLKKIDISRWWDNHDYQELSPLFTGSKLINKEQMDLQTVTANFQKKGIEFIHSWGSGGARHDKPMSFSIYY